MNEIDLKTKDGALLKVQEMMERIRKEQGDFEATVWVFGRRDPRTFDLFPDGAVQCFEYGISEDAISNREMKDRLYAMILDQNMRCQPYGAIMANCAWVNAQPGDAKRPVNPDDPDGLQTLEGVEGTYEAFTIYLEHAECVQMWVAPWRSVEGGAKEIGEFEPFLPTEDISNWHHSGRMQLILNPEMVPKYQAEMDKIDGPEMRKLLADTMAKMAAGGEG